MLNGTTINSGHSNRKVKELTIGDFKKKHIVHSYWWKEFKTLVRTPIFCLQCVVMPVAYPILVFIVMYAFVNFARSIGIDALKEFYDRIMTTWGVAIFISIGQVFYMMNFASIIAISREAKNAILMKYLPISLEKQIQWKLKIGIITNLISGIVVSITYYLVIRNVIHSIFMFVLLFYLNTVGEKVKVLIDLKNPQVTWDSEYTMMKQNTNVMYELFYTFVMMVILIVISFLIKRLLVFIIFILMLFIVANAILNEYIHCCQGELVKKIV